MREMNDIVRCETKCCNYSRTACNEFLAATILFAPMICIPVGVGVLYGWVYFNIGSIFLGAFVGITLAKLSLMFGIIRNRSITGCGEFCEKKVHP